MNCWKSLKLVTKKAVKRRHPRPFYFIGESTRKLKTQSRNKEQLYSQICRELTAIKLHWGI
jgi:hypothetical protein